MSKFYIQDSRSFVGNDVLWHAKDNKGYTTNLDCAQTYTREEAEAIYKNRQTDVMWPVEYIDTVTIRAVDMQYAISRLLKKRNNMNDDSRLDCSDIPREEIVGTTSIDEELIATTITPADIEEELRTVAFKHIKERRIIEALGVALKQVEANDGLVTDIVCDSNNFSILRKLSIFESENRGIILKLGLMGKLWHIRVWVTKDTKGIQCYQENSTQLKSDYPQITDSIIQFQHKIS